MSMLKVNIAGVPHAYEITERRTGNEANNTTAPQTLVFVHGWMLSQAYWRPLVDLLSSHYRCLTYDLRGFGESIGSSPMSQLEREITLPGGRTLPADESKKEPVSADSISAESLSANSTAAQTDRAAKTSKTQTSKAYTASAYSLAAYAEDLRALLDKLGIEQAWLLGHSLGGSIALWAAYLLSDRIKGVVCINAGGGIYIPKEFDKFRSAGQQMVKYRPAWLQQLPLLPNVFARLMVRQPLALHWGAQRVQDFVRAEHQAAVGALLETTSADEVHLLPQVVSQITQPAHFITAAEDTVMLPQYVHHLASFHPHFSETQSLSEIAECGHMAMVEQPQAVADVIRAVVPDR